MGTKVIKGRKKGSQETSYFLSHGDAVIMGSGNSKKTLTTKLGEVDGRIDTINGKIPAEASSGNPLADKDYVTTQVGNKTVDTAHIDNGAVTTVKIADGNVTKVKLAQDVLNFLEEYLADFKGTVGTTAALKALTGNKNDWAVYQHTDSNNNVIYSRYRYDESYNDATTGKWKFELDVNSSSFTAAQWAAINSGITSEAVAKANGAMPKSGGTFTGDVQIENHDLTIAGTPEKGATLNLNETRICFDDTDFSISHQNYGILIHSRDDINLVWNYGHDSIRASEIASKAEVGAKENSYNKVTSFNNPTDTQYPSAKLVKDQLDAVSGNLGGYEFDEVDMDTLLS